MKKRINFIFISFVIMVILFLLIKLPGSHVLLSQYIGEYKEEIEDTEDVKKEIKREMKKDGALPPHIAYNFKAVKIPYMQDSVRLSWNINPHYDDQFIIGRSNEIIDTADRAKSSKSINVITSRSKNVYVDQGLKPGKYYYVILSKDKIVSMDLELYRDINFTSFPVLIEPPKAKLSHATGIEAKNVGDNKILVTWNKVAEIRSIYNIYRANYIIDSQNKLKNAKRIGAVVDNDEYLDEKIGGMKDFIFYAVTTKDSSGTENLKLQLGQNFTTTGIKLKKKSITTINNINAHLADPNTILIKWQYKGDMDDENIGGFEIYRSNKTIDSPDRLDSAIKLKSTDERISEFTDRINSPGNYYYAVFVKFRDGVINASLVKNQNYTTKPVIVADRFGMKYIRAESSDRGVVIEWNFSGIPENRYYKLFRIKKFPDTIADVEERNILRAIDITSRGFTDRRVPEGKFYYGLIPESDDDDFRIVRGVTITESVISRKKTGTIQRKEKIEKTEKKRVIVSDIEIILKRTFFKGYYRESLKELKNVIKSSDNIRDIAKANLFIGRTYIEMKKYRRALDYLIIKGVGKYYSVEAKFWSEFAMMRLSR